MSDPLIRRINLCSFLTALATIAAGVPVGVMGLGVVPGGRLLWQLLATDAIVFAEGVLTNLAIAC